MGHEFVVRLYDPTRDEATLRACFTALQDHEHDFAPDAPTGAELVDTYVPFMIERATTRDSRLFVAEAETAVVGFASALIRQRDEPDDLDERHVEVAELSVLPKWRSRGIGTQLLSAAEEFAHHVGIDALRIRVDVRNGGARRLYLRHGFSDAVVTMQKRLAAVVVETPPARLHHLALGARDVSNVAAFYRDVLGMTEVQRHLTDVGSVRSIWLRCSAGSVLMIEQTSADLRPVDGVGAGLFLLALQSSGRRRQQLEARLRGAGCPMDGTSEHTTYFRDPEGNRVAVSSYPLP